jgi:peptidoglycan/xylan/chitin deacetylase (PgdA/CDA1 family)
VESGLGVRRVGDLPEAPGGQKATVCVTFDDGYLDNWRDAAPILDRYGIPATFFVTTGYLGTSRRFHWDIRDGIIAPMMDWDHASALAATGHEIGAHTRTHPDLGKPMPVESLEDEIVGSADDIECRLGFRPKSFAFPFGRWENMLPAVVEVAQRAFPICCSAVRGRMRLPLVAGMAVRRVSVQPTWSSAEFRAELAGVFDFLERFRR